MAPLQLGLLQMTIGNRGAADFTKELDLGKLTKTPTGWCWTVNGHPIELTTNELMGQNKFFVRIQDKTSILVRNMAESKWRDVVANHLHRSHECQR